MRLTVLFFLSLAPAARSVAASLESNLSFTYSCPAPKGKEVLCIKEPIEAGREVTLLRKDESEVCKAVAVERSTHSAAALAEGEEEAPGTRLELSNSCSGSSDSFFLAVLDGKVSGYKVLALDKVPDEDKIGSLDRKAREEMEVLDEQSKEQPMVLRYPLPKSIIYLAQYKFQNQAGHDFGPIMADVNGKMSQLGESLCARLGVAFRKNGQYYLEAFSRPCNSEAGVEHIIFRSQNIGFSDAYRESQ